MDLDDIFAQKNNGITINVWRYRPGNLNDSGKEGFDVNWEKDQQQGVINQKQERLGDISRFSSLEKLRSKRDDNTGRVYNAWAFCNIMKIDDIVIACKGRDEVVGIGRVVGNYYYCENDDTRFHKRKVRWISTKPMRISHGLQQGSLLRFDLSKENNIKKVKAILHHYDYERELNAQILNYQDEACVFPESDGISGNCYEGAIERISVNKYERNGEARKKCIEHYGTVCKICGFDFGKTYGEIGEGFIHVHHIVPISEIGKEYKIDYKNDLIPVCPNCHAMLHRRKKGEVLLPDELRRIIREISCRAQNNPSEIEKHSDNGILAAEDDLL